MTESTTFWTDLATTHQPPSVAIDGVVDAAASLVVAPDASAAQPAQAGTLLTSTVALHPRLRLALDELLDAGQVQTTHNLAILIGRVWHIAARRPRPGTEANAAAGRYQISDYEVREDLFRLEIQEVAGDALDSAITSYSMELAISHRLLESGLFVDGQRLAICGPLRMERTYDPRFATAATDPGRPDWTTKLEVLSMLAVDETTPDGSFVELIGVVEGEPRIRREMVGAGAFEPFATVRLRCRRQLRSGIGRSRAVFSTSTVLPLEVALNGDLNDAGALLRAGNMVHIHGRLVQYRYQLPVRAPSNTAARADRKGIQDILNEIAATARARLEQRQPGADAVAVEREVRRAQQRFLTVMKPTIEVGYVELQHGTALTDTEIAELIAHWRPGPASDRTRSHGDRIPSDQNTVADGLDEATAAAFRPEPAAAPLPVAPVRPRRRSREEEASAGGDTGDAA
jgi:hypothetical protein